MSAVDEEFEPGPGWADKTGFAPGMPEDAADIPTMRYQVLHGRVFTLTRWRDGSTARGETELAVLQKLVDGPIREGWYNAVGDYLGDNPGLED